MKRVLSTLLAGLLITSGCVFTTASMAAENDADAKGFYKEDTMTDDATLTEEVILQGDTFDEENVILRFGVVSDIHQNGVGSGKVTDAPQQEWSHAIDVLQKTAKEKDPNAKLDAILIGGDMVDGIANGGSNVRSFSSYGDRATQNMREVANFARGVWGSDNGVTFTADKKVINPATSGKNDAYMTAGSVNGRGNGFDDTTKLFYVLGNHDESARGVSDSFTKEIDGTSITLSKVYAADLFAAVLCGWQHNPDSSSKAADGYETANPYRNYIADLIDYNTNDSTAVTADTFASKYGVTLASADALFDKYFGHLDKSTTLTDTADGLRLGNMHMTIGEGNDRIHFIGIELSMSDASLAWAKKILDTSVAENPNKPIFIISHYTPQDAMYIGDHYGKTAITDLLEQYPQAITWGGHSHTTIHNDTAINSDLGYITIESNTTRYLDTAKSLTLTKTVNGVTNTLFGEATSNSASYPYTPFNYNKHEASVSNAAYVEVDANFNVRIKRMDLYRSYSEDYAENSDFYTVDKFTNFENYAYNTEFEATDAPVFIRDAWDVTNISSNGSHLAQFSTNAREASTTLPAFENEASAYLSSEGIIGGLNITLTLDAKDEDGMVMLYVLEIKDPANNNEVVHRRYYTNFYYEFPQDPALGNIPGNYITSITETAKITGLELDKEYTVELFAVDDFYQAGEPISISATTSSGQTYVELEDGKKGVFVDTTGENASYVFENTEYLVYDNFKTAFEQNPNVIYYIAGSVDLNVITDRTPKGDLTVIGLNRDNAEFYYSSFKKFQNGNVVLKDVTIDKLRTNDDIILVHGAGSSLTLDSVKVKTNPLNIHLSDYNGEKDPTVAAPLTIKGDTGEINYINGPVYSGTGGNYINGDVYVTIEGGIFKGAVIGYKNTGAQGIHGNAYLTITGGTFNGTVSPSSTSSNETITKNAVTKIFGGNFENATIGLSGTTYVNGKDIIITTKEIKESAKTFNKPNNGILILVPEDNTDAIGDATVNGNGYITSYAIKQIPGIKSYVNEVEATEIILENGKEYVVTYEIDEDYSKVELEVTVPVIEGATPYNKTYADGTVYNNLPKITIRDEDGKAVYTQQGTDSLSIGVYLKKDAEYTIEVTKNGYLKYESVVTVGENGLEIPDITLIPGDIKSNYADDCGDGVIDSNDFVRVLRGFATGANEKLKDAVDINEDGVIDVDDLLLVKNNLRSTSSSYLEEN
ncbi:MAG: metallophosphoesterase [Clostridia bacterium]|nr:metallophosphoesterase [Clostridia bacterium]